MRTFTTSRGGWSPRAIFRALGMPMPVTQSLHPRERRARLFQTHAAALASQAVLLWQATRRRVLTLDEIAAEDGADPSRRLITFDRFA
jgi:hypothetical protein